MNQKLLFKRFSVLLFFSAFFIFAISVYADDTCFNFNDVSFTCPDIVSKTSCDIFSSNCEWDFVCGEAFESPECNVLNKNQCQQVTQFCNWGNSDYAVGTCKNETSEILYCDNLTSSVSCLQASCYWNGESCATPTGDGIRTCSVLSTSQFCSASSDYCFWESEDIGIYLNSTCIDCDNKKPGDQITVEIILNNTNSNNITNWVLTQKRNPDYFNIENSDLNYGIQRSTITWNDINVSNASSQIFDINYTVWREGNFVMEYYFEDFNKLTRQPSEVPISVPINDSFNFTELKTPPFKINSPLNFKNNLSFVNLLSSGTLIIEWDLNFLEYVLINPLPSILGSSNAEFSEFEDENNVEMNLTFNTLDEGETAIYFNFSNSTHEYVSRSFFYIEPTPSCTLTQSEYPIDCDNLLSQNVCSEFSGICDWNGWKCNRATEGDISCEEISQANCYDTNLACYWTGDGFPQIPVCEFSGDNTDLPCESILTQDICVREEIACDWSGGSCNTPVTKQRDCVVLGNYDDCSLTSGVCEWTGYIPDSYFQLNLVKESGIFRAQGATKEFNLSIFNSAKNDTDINITLNFSSNFELISAEWPNVNTSTNVSWNNQFIQNQSYHNKSIYFKGLAEGTHEIIVQIDHFADPTQRSFFFTIEPAQIPQVEFYSQCDTSSSPCYFNLTNFTLSGLVSDSELVNWTITLRNETDILNESICNSTSEITGDLCSLNVSEYNVNESLIYTFILNASNLDSNTNSSTIYAKFDSDFPSIVNFQSNISFSENTVDLSNKTIDFNFTIVERNINNTEILIVSNESEVLFGYFEENTSEEINHYFNYSWDSLTYKLNDIDSDSLLAFRYDTNVTQNAIFIAGEALINNNPMAKDADSKFWYLVFNSTYDYIGVTQDTWCIDDVCNVSEFENLYFDCTYLMLDGENYQYSYIGLLPFEKGNIANSPLLLDSYDGNFTVRVLVNDVLDQEYILEEELYVDNSYPVVNSYKFNGDILNAQIDIFNLTINTSDLLKSINIDLSDITGNSNCPSLTLLNDTPDIWNASCDMSPVVTAETGITEYSESIDLCDSWNNCNNIPFNITAIKEQNFEINECYFIEEINSINLSNVLDFSNFNFYGSILYNSSCSNVAEEIIPAFSFNCSNISETSGSVQSYVNLTNSFSYNQSFTNNLTAPYLDLDFSTSTDSKNCSMTLYTIPFKNISDVFLPDYGVEFSVFNLTYPNSTLSWESGYVANKGYLGNLTIESNLIRNFVIDDINAPEILYGINSDYFTTSSIILEFNLTDFTSNLMKVNVTSDGTSSYSYSNGTSYGNVSCNWNYTFANCTISYDNLEDVGKWINFEIEDIYGNINSTFKYILVDTIIPQITLASPSSNTFMNDISGILWDALIVDDNFNRTELFLYNSTNGIINQTNLTSTSQYLWFNVTDGNYSLNYTLYDISSNKVSEKIENIVVDRINPMINVTNSQDLSGSIASDFIFFNITFFDTNLNFSNVSVNYDGSLLFNKTVYATSNESILAENITGLAEGEYEIFAKTTDLAGNSNQSISYFVFLDSSAPSVSNSNYTSQNYSETEDYSLLFNLSEPASKIDCFIDNEFRGNFSIENSINITESIPGNYEFFFGDISAGSHVINCTFRDFVNLSNELIISDYFLFEAEPPLDINISEGCSNNLDNICLYGENYTISGTGCPSQLFCNLTLDGSDYDSEVVLPPGTYQMNYTTEGNENYSNFNYNISLLIEKAINVMDLSVDGVNSSIDEVMYRTPGRYLVSSKASEKGLINLTVDGVFKAEETEGEVLYNYDFDFEGSYLVETNIEEIDNYSSNSKNMSVIIDDTNPVLTLTNIDYEVNISNISFEYCIEELYLNEREIILIKDDSIYNQYSTNLGEGCYEFIEEGVSDGNYTLNISLFDLAGNSFNFTSETILVDTIEPILNLYSPEGGCLNDNYINLNYSVVDLNLGRADVLLFKDNSLFYENYDNFSLETDITGIEYGGYTLNITIYDEVNNSVNNSVQFFVDNIEPTYTLNYPFDGNLSAGKNISFNFTAIDDYSKNYSLELYDEEGQLVTKNEGNLNSFNETILLDVEVVEDGYYNASINITDHCDNSVNFNVTNIFRDTTPPSVIIFPEFKKDNLTTHELTCSFSDSFNVTSLKILVSDENENEFILKEITDEIITENVLVNFTTYDEGKYLWNCFVYDELGNEGSAEIYGTIIYNNDEGKVLDAYDELTSSILLQDVELGNNDVFFNLYLPDEFMGTNISWTVSPQGFVSLNETRGEVNLAFNTGVDLIANISRRFYSIQKPIRIDIGSSALSSLTEINGTVNIPKSSFSSVSPAIWSNTSIYNYSQTTIHHLYLNNVAYLDSNNKTILDFGNETIFRTLMDSILIDITVFNDTQMETGKEWNRLFKLPQKLNLEIDGKLNDTSFSVGSGLDLIFNKSVEIEISGKAGFKVARFSSDNVEELLPLCGEEKEDCYQDSGSNLLIYTTHFSNFLLYKDIVSPPSGGDTSSGGGSDSGSGAGSGGSGFIPPPPVINDTKEELIFTKNTYLINESMNLTEKNDVEFGITIFNKSYDVIFDYNVISNNSYVYLNGSRYYDNFSQDFKISNCKYFKDSITCEFLFIVEELIEESEIIIVEEESFSFKGIFYRFANFLGIPIEKLILIGYYSVIYLVLAGIYVLFEYTRSHDIFWRMERLNKDIKNYRSEKIYLKIKLIFHKTFSKLSLTKRGKKKSLSLKDVKKRINEQRKSVKNRR